MNVPIVLNNVEKMKIYITVHNVILIDVNIV